MHRLIRLLTLAQDRSAPAPSGSGGRRRRACRPGRAADPRGARTGLAASRCWFFVAVTLGWTWTLGFGAAVAQGPAVRPLHLAALLGPVVGLVVVLSQDSSSGYRRSLLRRTLDVRGVRPAWWAAVVGVGAGPALLAAGGAAALGEGVRLSPDATGAGIAGIVGFAVTAGLVEEPGWRGVGIEGATRRLGFTWGALTIGALWSLWHLPLYFISGTFQQGLGVGTPDFWASMLDRVPLAVLLAWLVAGSRGMVVAAVAAHAMGNMIGEVLETGPIATFTEVAVTGLAAVAVLLAWGSREAQPLTSKRGRIRR